MGLKKCKKKLKNNDQLIMNYVDKLNLKFIFNCTFNQLFVVLFASLN